MCVQYRRLVHDSMNEMLQRQQRHILAVGYYAPHIALGDTIARSL